MFETLKNAFRNKDIRKKIIITLLILLVFRVGCYIPVPGLRGSFFSAAIEGNTFLQLMSSITGGSLASGTLFALGIGPYINASIIMQLLTVGIPPLERLSKQGEEGRKKISNITRIITVVLAVVQAVGIIVNFANQEVDLASGETGTAIKLDMFFDSAVFAGFYMTIVYTAGAMLVMWLGERITEYGIGNGISMIIFIGILSTAGDSVVAKFIEGVTADPMAFLELAFFVVLVVVIFFLIVFVDLAERKIPVNYAKQVRGTKMYGGQSSVIPMKIAGGGVMPLIFAFAVISFPSMLMSLVPAWADAAAWWNSVFMEGTWIYVLVLSVLIFVFAFFYNEIQFNPEDVSKNIQQNGGFIQGIRPGKPTAQYLRRISKRITLFGAIYLTAIAFIPSLAFSWASYDLVNVFSTTGILIVVSVALEFDKQLQSQIMMKTYKGFLK